MKNSKRVLSASLAVLMCASAFTAVSASAAEDTESTVYVNEDETYSAEKISHSGKGVKTTDGIVDYLGDGVVDSVDSVNGDGDRCQNYSWAAASYGDYMYIGTCASSMMSTLQLMKAALGDNYDEETMTAALNAMFNGTFYISEEDGGDPKSVLLKLNTKTGEVKLLMSKATTGSNVMFRNAVNYGDKIYFCGSVAGVPSICMVDPETDECSIVYQSMTIAQYYMAYLQGYSVGIRGMCEYNGELIVSMIGTEGAYICSTKTPWDADSYEVIADMDDLFNYPAYMYSDSIYGGSVWDMVEYNDELYVSICTGTQENKPDDNSMQSFAIVKANEDENGKWSWSCVVGDTENDGAKYTFGIDPERTRSGAANLIVYDGYLYIGEYNDEEIALENILFDQDASFMNANLEQSVNLYRMDENENVELVVGDADEMFPDGSLTGYGSGFGNNENQYIWRMQVYDGKLYVGTFDTSSLLEPLGQFTNGDLFNMTEDEWASQIEYLQTLVEILKEKNSSADEAVAVADENVTDEQIAAGESLIEDTESDDTSIDIMEELNKKLEEFKALINEKVSEFSTKLYTQMVESLKTLIKNSVDFSDIYGNLINNETLAKIESIATCASYLSTAERGFDLYAIDSDMNVETITTDGFGDPYNHGCRVFAVTDQGLFLGTANPFYGTQVWSVEEIESEEALLGDVNLDGIIDITDATLLQKYLADIVDLSDEAYDVSDVNEDGVVDIADVTTIQKIIAKII